MVPSGFISTVFRVPAEMCSAGSGVRGVPHREQRKTVVPRMVGGSREVRCGGGLLEDGELITGR